MQDSEDRQEEYDAIMDWLTGEMKDPTSVMDIDRLDEIVRNAMTLMDSVVDLRRDIERRNESPLAMAIAVAIENEAENTDDEEEEFCECMEEGKKEDTEVDTKAD
jgi:hypothetical protein